MATFDFAESLVNGLPAEIKPAMNALMRYLLRDGRLSFGVATSGSAAQNMEGFFLAGTTSSVANTKSTFKHGLGTAPHLCIPVLALDTVNATIVPLTVWKAADSTNLYLSSSSANAPFVLYVE